jgi:hypothetical protein
MDRGRMINSRWDDTFKEKLVMVKIEGKKSNGEVSDKNFELAPLLIKSQSGKERDCAPFLASVLPMTLQSAFKKAFSEKFPQHVGEHAGSVLLTGKEEPLFYQWMDQLKTTEPLPDVLVTSGFNRLYSCKWLNEKTFEPIRYPIHSIYSETNISHPAGLLSVIASDALVMVTKKSKYENKAMPREWYELLNPSLSKSIVFCGDRDALCLHFVKNYGFEAIKYLGKNTLAGFSPEEMPLFIHSGYERKVSVYVMPYSYARYLQNEGDYEVVWPDDGAILIPTQLLLKKGSGEKYEEVIRFLTGSILGDAFERKGIFSTNAETSRLYPGGKLNWIGWDFIQNSHLSVIKKKIETYFP